MEKKDAITQAIIDILIKHQVIPEKDAKAMHKAFKDSEHEYFEDFLIEEGIVDDINVLRSLSEYYKVPAFDVVGYFFDYHQLHKFPKGYLLRNGIIPLEVDENIMIVVAAQPDDPDLLSSLGQHVSYDIQFRVGLRRNIVDAIEEFYDRAVTEVPEGLDIDEEQKMQEEVEREIEEDPIVPYAQEDEIIPDAKEPNETEEE